MSKQALKHPNKAADTGSYSAAVLCDGWVYVSGHASLDLTGGEVLAGTAGEETDRALRHIGVLLAAAGCGFDDVVKCTCHLANIEDFEVFDAAYRKFFTGVLPARTTVQSVLWGGLKVEIDAIARVPRQSAES